MSYTTIFSSIVQILVLVLLVIVVYLQYMPPVQILTPNSSMFATYAGYTLNSKTPYYKVSKGLYVNSDGSLCAVVMVADDGNKYGFVCPYGEVKGDDGITRLTPMFPPSTSADGSWAGFGQIPCKGMNVCYYPGFDKPPPYLASASTFVQATN